MEEPRRGWDGAWSGQLSSCSENRLHKMWLISWIST